MIHDAKSKSELIYNPKLVAGTQLLTDDERIRKIYDYDILRNSGFMIKSRYATKAEKTSSLMRIKYYLAKYRPKDPDDYGHMPVLPSNYKGNRREEFKYYVEHDLVENKARLCGANTSILGKDIDWFYFDGGYKKSIIKFSSEEMLKNPMSYFRESSKALQTKLDQLYFNITDVPLMITDQGELLAIPTEMGDVGHKIICGSTGSGKTWLLHLLMEGDYFKSNSNQYYINDSVRQTETWCKENYEDKFKFKLSLFNIVPNSMPLVYLFPKLKEDAMLINPDEDMSFEFSLSFDDLMSDFDSYMEGLKNNELGASGGYLEESMEEIKTADNLNEINDILEELLCQETIGKGSYNKLKKIFKVLDTFNFIDKFNGVESKWTFKKGDTQTTTYPMIGLAENNVIPSLITDVLKSKPFYPQVMGYLLKIIAENQKHKKIRRSKIYYDELSDAFMKGNEKTILSKIIREITLKGRNTDIELNATIQNFTDMDDAIKGQMSYVFSFVHNDEKQITAIAKWIGIDSRLKTTICDLDKLQCFAWCRGDIPFVLYSPDKGRRVVYGREQSLYKGRLLPTMSLHKIPNKEKKNVD